MIDALPEMLVDPPWEREARAYREATAAARAAAGKDDRLVPGLEPPAGQSLVWEFGEHEEWLKLCDRPPFSSEQKRSLLRTEGWTGVVRVYGEGKLTYTPDQADMFTAAPEELVRPLLAEWNPRFESYGGTALKALTARFGLDVRHVVFANIAKVRTAQALMPFLDVEAARLAADWLVRLRSRRREARDWFARHGVAAVPFLVPDALDKRRVPREKARAALALIASAHGAPAVVDAARRFGDRAADTVERILAGDTARADTGETPKAPVAKPVKPSKTPWLDRGALPDVRLRDGRALPPEAVENLIGALVLSPGVPWNGRATMYPGLDDVLGLCDRASLAAFGRAIFENWITARTPSRSGWVLDQLCRTADDEAVRRVGALLLRTWPAPGTDKHAVQVLREIGTDTALTQLDRIARQAKAPGRRSAAEGCLALAARTRGLTADELADRLVPDLGLDDAGTLVLDYGPRRFTVGFDEGLRPFVVDEAGRHRKALPKPGAKDDGALAPAAYRRFAELKKEVRDVAADQIRRLERAMVTGRRWSVAEFERYFVRHPLLWHIARRLVWTADGTRFRLAEDRTPADADDEAMRLPETARVGIPHPVELGDALREWARVFADYEIVQPFAQLGRPVDALTEAERRTGRLERFEGVTVPSGAVLGLLRRGWERGPVEDGGVHHTVVRRLPGEIGDLLVVLEPGIAVTAVDALPQQTITEVGFVRPPGDALDPVGAAELLADLSSLA
ncbi:hypothetical protein GCM10010182_48570 [Actinomadura cremea]|nr:hypothetical protein GCM10010182_48570 [Actinomadura cremea]